MNNIFADNRAGWAELPTAENFNTSALRGIGQPGDTTDIQRWDIGVSDTTGLIPAPSTAFGSNSANNTTNAQSVLVNAPGGFSYTATGTNNIDPTTDGTTALAFVNPQDFLVDSLMWRSNTNVSFPVIVAHMVPVNLLADYHLTDASPLTLAINGGAASGAGTAVPTPAHDIDGDGRPAGGGYERGADEHAIVINVDLGITVDDGVATVQRGDAVTYTLVVTNTGAGAANNAQVSWSVPSALQSATWTCSATSGANCGGSGSGSNSISRQVNVAVGATVTFLIHATVRSNATGTIDSTATVTKSAGDNEANTGNNSATDSDTVLVPTGDLQIDKTSNRTSVSRSDPNQTVVYTVTLTNSVGADTATGATFTDAVELPHQLQRRGRAQQHPDPVVAA